MTDAPLLLLPLRLETWPARDGRSDVLLIRAWPDQIHLDLLRRSVSTSERALMAEWRDQARQDRAAASRRLESVLGRPRASFLLDANARGVDLPLDDTLGPPPVARALPERLVARVTMTDGRTVRTIGERIPEAVPMGPGDDDTRAFDGSGSDPLRWMQDFDLAREIGLALRVDLGRPRPRIRVARIVVIGVPGHGDPVADQARFDALMTAHAGSDGLGVLPAGMVTKGAPGAVSLPERRMPLAQALGLSADSIAGQTLDRAGDAAAKPIANLVWKAALRPALRDAWLRGPDDTATFEIDQLERIGERYCRSVRPQGPYPAMQVGAQAYGVHPMLTPGTAREDTPARVIEGLIPELAQQGRERTAASRTDGWTGLLRALTHSPATEVTRLRRMHPLVSWINLVANANHWGGGLREADRIRAEKMQAMGLGPLGEAKHGPFMAGDPTTRLLTVPMIAGIAPDGEVRDANALRTTLSQIASWRGVTLDRVFGAHRGSGNLWESGMDSLVQVMALSALRWGLLELVAAADSDGDPARIAQALGPDDIFLQPGGGWRTLLRETLRIDPAQARVEEVLEHPVVQTRAAAGPLAELRTFLDLERALDRIPPDQVARALSGALDAASHRFDAWLSAEATEQIEAHRRRTPTGLRLGAWAMLEGDGTDQGGNRGPAIHFAPSADHAITAATLHEAAVAAADDRLEPHRFNLTASAMRDATRLARAIREGRDPSAHLGEVAARILTENGLSQLVRPLAEAFPLRGRQDERSVPQDDTRIDGHALVDLARDGSPIAVRVQGVAMNIPDPAATQISQTLTRSVEGYHNLLTTEGLHAAIHGRTINAAAAFEALAGGGPPPEAFSVLGPPPGAASVVTRVSLGSDRTDPLDALRDLAATLAGPPVGRVTAHVEADGRRRVHRIEMADLNLSPFPVVASTPPGADPKACLRVAVLTHLAKTGIAGTVTFVFPDSAGADWLWSCGLTSQVLHGARPLAATDLEPGHSIEPLPTDLAATTADPMPGDPHGAVLKLLELGRIAAADRAANALIGGEADAAAMAAAALSDLAAEIGAIPTPAERAAAIWPGLPMPARIASPSRPTARAIDPPDAAQLTDWIDGLQTVEDRLAPLADLMLGGADLSVGATITQWQDGVAPDDVPTKWIARSVDPNTIQGVIETRVTFHADAPGASWSGLALVDWTEGVAPPNVDAGLTIRTPIPPGRAGNVVVLCPPSPDLETSDPDAMLALVDRLADEMAMRVLDLTNLPGSGEPQLGEPTAHHLGLFLPLLWLPPEPFQDPEAR